MAIADITGPFIEDRGPYQEMPVIIRLLAHFALAVDIDDTIGFLISREHRGKIGMATLAVRIDMSFRIRGKGRIDRVVLMVVHVYILDVGHRIDDVESVLQCPFIIFHHRMIQCAFDQGTDIISVLADDRIHRLFIHRFVYEPERCEKNDGNDQYYHYQLSIDGRTEIQFSENVPAGMTFYRIFRRNHPVLF
jgi:hypothetical protein